jgi:hypothetical protein
VFPGGSEEFAGGEGHGCCVEDATGRMNEWDDQNEFEWVDDVVADLRGGYIEAEDKCQGEAENGGAAEDGIDADEEAGGDAPGELFRRGSHAKEREYGESNAAVEPVVVDRSGARGGVVAI